MGENTDQNNFEYGHFLRSVLNQEIKISDRFLKVSDREPATSSMLNLPVHSEVYKKLSKIKT